MVADAFGGFVSPLRCPKLRFFLSVVEAKISEHILGGLRFLRKTDLMPQSIFNNEDIPPLMSSFGLEASNKEELFKTFLIKMEFIFATEQ